MSDDRKKAFWFIALLSMLVILPFLGETIFYSKGEPREAIVAFSMLESGNWILPVNYGTDIAYKPPFLYWAIAAISSLFGGVSEYSSRLPSAIAFLAMQLVFFSFIAKRKGVKTAFLTSILLLSSFEVHRAAVACRVDMLQVSLIVISLCLLFRWDEKECRGIPWLAVLLMGCATLTKGPVGSIFPCVCIGLYQLLRGRSFWKTFFLLLLVGILSLIPYAAWAGAAYAQGGQSFVDLMLEENTGRFMGKMSYGSHENPMWYNFLTVIWGWIPWTLVLLLSLFGLKWKNMRVLPEGTSFGERIGKAWKKFRSQSPLQLFTWVVILFIFIFYCIPKSKRSVYLLPIYPFMAVLIAEYLLALVQRGAKVFKISAHIFASLCLILTVTFIAVRLGLIPDSLFGTGRHLYSIAGCMLCLFVSLDGVYQPTVLAVKSDKHLVNQIREYVPQGTVYSYDGMSFYCANFYMNDQMRHFEKDLPSGEGYVVLPERGKELLFEEFGNTYDFEEIFLTKKRSCDLRDEIYMYKFKKK